MLRSHYGSTYKRQGHNINKQQNSEQLTSLFAKSNKILSAFFIQCRVWTLENVFNMEFQFMLQWFTVYGPMCNAFYAGSIHYKGKWEGDGPWKLRLFWALWNGIEPIGKCHFSARKKLHRWFYVQDPMGDFKGAQVWDFDVLDFNDFFIMKSL